ncbi:large ribosomal subunit protein uL30m-like [Asterias amurensis]|uniref:large ribosomal subunit protein uL30m-like n=1 Tax=Asterias amurensis TaxID=7602 RepID=UPI003AB6C7AA
MAANIRELSLRFHKIVQFLRPGSCFGIPGSPNPTRQCSSLTPRPPSSEGALEKDEDRPHMLHVVWRTRSLKRRPYWERKIIQQLMLQRNDFPVVHKNIESVNILLRKVRHLIRVKPLSLKYGLPNGDYSSTLLKWNGEFIVNRKLDNIGHEIPAGKETSESSKDNLTEEESLR